MNVRKCSLSGLIFSAYSWNIRTIRVLVSAMYVESVVDNCAHFNRNRVHRSSLFENLVEPVVFFSAHLPPNCASVLFDVLERYRFWNSDDWFLCE